MTIEYSLSFFRTFALNCAISSASAILSNPDAESDINLRLSMILPFIYHKFIYIFVYVNKYTTFFL